MMRASYRIAAGYYQERVEVISEDELGQLAHSFNQMAATLEETETMRRDLMAKVAHELRTPLASIKGYMEGLMDDVLPIEPATFQQIYREADRLQHLMNDLQELSQVEAGAFKLDCRPVVVTDLIQQ
jgi:histidine kinase